MPRMNRPDWSPKYRKHKKSEQAVITISGRDYYLGPHGTKTSYAEYDRLILEWRANGREIQPDESVTVNEVLAAFLKFAKQHYRKNGRQTGSIERVKQVIKKLKAMYGDSAADEFGPRKLKAFRQSLIRDDCSRAYINDLVALAKRIFRWLPLRK